jgi:AraC-like DNA-binding protein
MLRHLLLLIIVLIFQSSTSAESCVTFDNPKPGKIISQPQCTLQLSSTCNTIKKINLQARYFAENSDTATIVTIGTIQRAPYIFVWDISKIPNQMFAGVAFLAEVTHRYGDREDVRQEGIFFAHQNIAREQKNMHYDFSKTTNLHGDIINIPTIRENLNIKASVYWNENFLTFLIDVDDPFFHSHISKNSLAEMGIELYIDPTLSSKPYPSKDIIAFAVPLSGIPYSITFKPGFDSAGGFRLVSSSTPCDFSYSILKDDYKGYKLLFPIPSSTFTNSNIPDSFACNIILKALNNNYELNRISWVKGNIYDNQSPFLWNKLVKQKKPIYKNNILIFASAFVIGLILTLFTGLIISTLRRPHFEKAIAKTEAEQRIFDELKEAVERQVTYKNLSVEIVAKELKISAKKLNLLCKNFTSFSFANYLMYSRIEIAKERLRSSHCSESTIADACGFQNEQEFMKYFLKFNRITPEKYRQKQQVT